MIYCALPLEMSLCKLLASVLDGLTYQILEGHCLFTSEMHLAVQLYKRGSHL